MTSTAATEGKCAGCGEPLSPSGGHRARKWCSERCRKGSYGDPCVDCGARTSYGSERARIPEPRCTECARVFYRLWTREAIIRAIRDWAALHGEPPACADWSPYMARNAYHDEARARRYEAEHHLWPCHDTVFREFGSWNAGIAAAGFVPRADHGGAGNQLRRRASSSKAAVS